MSIESVKQFLAKCRDHQALQEKFQAVSTGTSEQRLAEVVRIAAAEGFEFTAADYIAAMRAELARQHAAGEINDEQLAMVAGAGAAATGTHIICCGLTK